MRLEPPFRPARPADSCRLAELVSMASGGVAEYVWSTNGPPDIPLLDIGAERYARGDGAFSWRNCIIAETNAEVIGMFMSFAAPDAPPIEPEAPDPVLAPYHELEAFGSWYVGSMAVLPEHRGRGLGTRMLGIARDLAQENGRDTLSLLAFSENPRSIALYRRSGFREIDRRPVVPHPLIRYGGDILLMTAPV